MRMLKLSTSSFDWALNQAEHLGDSEIFPLPFEFSAIRHDWSRLVGVLSSEDVLKWEVRSNRECLSPKSVHGFRIATQLDPLDWLVYNALVYEIGADLESHRLPQQERIVFSWRFDPQPDGTMFSGASGYSQFQERSRELADKSNEQYVVVSDITDFYPRLYHHRVENALSLAAPMKVNHTKAIMRLLGDWRESQSFGLPVGPNASRLIAEVAIHDVDQALLGEGLIFARYVDDYRIFCKTREEAYRALATLAEVLWKNHGLTTAERKTKILPVEMFSKEYLHTGRDTELKHLSESFLDIVGALGLEFPYDDIEYDNLDDDEKASVDALNLQDLLSEQLHCGDIDIHLTRFILRRLSQLQDESVIDEILESMDTLYPVFTDVVTYLGNLKHLSESRRVEVGKKILDLMDNSVASHLEYHQLHLLNLFASSSAWGNVDKIQKLLRQSPGHFAKRKLILALGKSGQNYWFRQRKAEWQEFSPWERRAFLRGASCLEGDERRHWYNSVRPRLDELESAIVSWSRQNPIDG